MTEDEYRQKMKEAGWDDEEIDEHLNRFYKCKNENDLLTLEMWRIIPKPYMETFRPASIERKKALQTEE